MSKPKQQTPRQQTPGVCGQVLNFSRPQPRSIPSPLVRPQETVALTVTWEMLETQLSDLAVTQNQRDLVRTLVSATRKQAKFKAPELVLREVLCIASVLMDETFHPELEEGEMT